MSMRLNTIVCSGNLTRDPEVKKLPSTTKCVLPIALNERWKSKSGEMKETTCFVDVEVWAKQAEACAESLKKGDHITVEGKLAQDVWESEGKKKSKHYIKATRVHFPHKAKVGRHETQDESHSF